MGSSLDERPVVARSFMVCLIEVGVKDDVGISLKDKTPHNKVWGFSSVFSIDRVASPLRQP